MSKGHMNKLEQAKSGLAWAKWVVILMNEEEKALPHNKMSTNKHKMGRVRKLLVCKHTNIYFRKKSSLNAKNQWMKILLGNLSNCKISSQRLLLITKEKPETLL